MEKPQWRTTALAIATAVLLGVSASEANALALGRVTVQSALGEPLRADIDIPQITAEELASLRATIASPEAFRTAGFDYNPAMANIQITLQRRPDGRPFLQLSSQRPVNDPFIDLILEANWSSGRIVRDYTMLFDPPNLRQSAPAVAAEVSPVAPAARTQAAPAPQASRPAVSAMPSARPSAPRLPPARAAGGDGKKVTVQSGDTASRIAAANKPTRVSLDQMLVALLHANPEAFIGGNVNRLKAGAVLDVPTAEQIELVSSGEASQNIIAQSRDFNDFRRRLAEGLPPATSIGGSERQASGRVQAQVEENKPAAATPDKLTLSKGTVQGKGDADKIARERAAQDEATRVAQLNKNISDLDKLGTATAPAALGGASTAKPDMALPLGTASAAKPTPAPAAAVPTASAPTAKAVADAPAAAAISPAASASVVAATTPAVSASEPLPAPPPTLETSLVDDLLENPIVPALVGAVLALLLGFGFYRARQRKKSPQVDSSFLESRLQPDSFFGASGGQRIDTNEGTATGSSMVYSPSQLDAAGDVDPVAEADVYLAYGRDLQAEEILKEAMRTTPQRVAVHGKLLEIYAKRRDARAFELIATEAYTLTRGEGTEWERICELGQDLDASNSLYRPGGHPAHVPAAAVAVGAQADDFGSQATQTMRVPATPEKPVDLDLDLDFSIGDDTSAPLLPGTASASHPTLAMDPPTVAEAMPALDLDFGSAAAALEPPADPELPAEPVIAPAATAAPTPVTDSRMIEFDLGALSLDFDSPSAAVSPMPFNPPAREPQIDETLDSTAGAPISTEGLEDDDGDPLATKLALAQEFNAIGDPDGARSLAEEVLAEASGDLKQKAQRFLAEIA